jgi:hypothetical protein
VATSGAVGNYGAAVRRLTPLSHATSRSFLRFSDALARLTHF